MQKIPKMNRKLALIAIVALVIIILIVIDKSQSILSPTILLNNSWANYKRHFITSDGRVVDNSAGGVTTSEAQSYAMLRAVFVNDKDTFNTVWNWTQDNLKRPNDNLFGWRWGKRADGSMGFLDNGGNNSASDADTDIVLALILAGKKWNNQQYNNLAKNILTDIWNEETMVVQGKRYLVGGNWVQASGIVYVNPSYFSPYAWRIFSIIDTNHNWNSLIDPAYELLNSSSYATLGDGQGVGLPPNWIVVNQNTGELEAPNTNSFNTDYSFDAARVPFRIALDYVWSKEPRALTYLQNNFSKLANDYNSNNKISIDYSHSGNAVIDAEGPTMYATSLACFKLINPALAKKIYSQKIVKLYTSNTNQFKSDIPYYDQNWLWFGTALYDNNLPNYFK